MSELRCPWCGAATLPTVERCVCGRDPRTLAALATIGRRPKLRRGGVGKTAYLAVGASAAVFFAVSQLPPRGEDTRVYAVPAYRMWKEDVSDTPGKAMIRQKIVLATRPHSPADVERLLRVLFEAASARRSFKYHPAPTVVAIYAYTSEEHAQSGSGWIGMILKAPTASTPEISIRSKAILMASVSETRFGLAEDVRRDAWREVILEERRASRDADQRVPLGARPSMTTLGRHSEIRERLAKEYADAVINRYGLTRDQLREISVEAFEKNWAAPQ